MHPGDNQREPPAILSGYAEWRARNCPTVPRVPVLLELAAQLNDLADRTDDAILRLGLCQPERTYVFCLTGSSRLRIKDPLDMAAVWEAAERRATNESQAMKPENLLYWGKYYQFENSEGPRLLWIGPMTKGEMIEYDDTFRHVSAKKTPALGNQYEPKKFVAKTPDAGAGAGCTPRDR